mmetsp:Transcript_1642/g.2053  ORF Transcript_1642/g.2053 Transcript_1642/m.2053 type:complete len:216 (+) Transcript_1642:155-802(+)
MLACHDGMAKLLFHEERSIGIEIQMISDQLLILQKLIVHVIRSWQSWSSVMYFFSSCLIRVLPVSYWSIACLIVTIHFSLSWSLGLGVKSHSRLLASFHHFFASPLFPLYFVMVTGVVLTDTNCALLCPGCRFAVFGIAPREAPQFPSLRNNSAHSSGKSNSIISCLTDVHASSLWYLYMIPVFIFVYVVGRGRNPLSAMTTFFPCSTISSSSAS